MIDLSAKARIDAQQAVLRAGGLTGIGFKGEGGDGDQFFANGTRMMTSGYDTQRGRKSAFGHGARHPGGGRAARSRLVLDGAARGPEGLGGSTSSARAS